MEQAAAPAAAKKSVQIEDVVAWKSIGTTLISNNGEWFAYRVAPQEGDAELTIRNVASGKETKFPLGEVGAPGGGAPAGAGGSDLVLGRLEVDRVHDDAVEGRSDADAPRPPADPEQRHGDEPGER